MRRRRLGRKGIKLRNKLIFISLILLLIFFINYNSYHTKKIEKEKYAIQTESLIKAENNIMKNMNGKTYYVSANGTSEDGTDINNPMSLEKANEKNFNGNDIVLFKSGDTFYGIIDFDVNTIEDQFFYIGSYGEGEMPIISGANILINQQAWQLEDGLYKLDLSTYSNFEGIGKTTRDPYNIGFFMDEKGKIYGERKQTKEKIKNEYDYYCENNFIYVKCDSNPSDKLGKIKFVSRNNLVNISSNTILENLNIQNTGAHGIVNKNNANIKNVYIKNCIIQNIGGSVQYEDTFTRYGNGLQFWSNATNTIVENCIFRNIYDAAYTMQGNVVNSGFENNICRNNVFINSTYTYETSCRNMYDDDIDIYMKGQQFIENISINQGKGWGYTVRPEKNAPAEFVIFSMPPNNTDIILKKNVYFNSRMLQYIDKNYGITENLYKENIDSDNNKIYLTENTLLLNSQGNYSSREILDEYGIEQNSEFYLLSDYEIEKISNEEILNSNNYDEIKAYYENLEEEFKYMEVEQQILEQYYSIASVYETQIQENAKLKQQISHLQEIFENLIKGDSIIDTEKTKELLLENYQLLNTLIDEDILNYEDIIKDINEIGNVYGNLFELNTIENNYNTTELNEQLNKISAKANENIDLGLDIVNYLVETSLEYNNKYIQGIEQTSASEALCKSIQVGELLKLADKILNINIEEYIKNAVVIVKYSTTELTNQNVTATLETTADIQVTNNSNSKEHTFEQNGSFTFEYTIKGQALEITATVQNIDKVAPAISGVQKAKLYTKPVTPKIDDENLQEIKLVLNSQVVSNYKNGDTLEEEGFYELTATDKAGNITSTYFQIFINTDTDYKIEDNYIKNVTNNTIKSDFDKKINLKVNYKITRNGTEITADEIIATGDILTTEAGDTYTIIVPGDINKDGKVNLKDFIKMRIYLLLENNLDDIEMLAADCNNDNQPIGVKDYIRMRLIILMNEH